MAKIKRIYQSIIDEHLEKYSNKMVLLAGPRQVGKTTLGHMVLNNESYNEIYLNWDNRNKQKLITGGFGDILQSFASNALSEQDKVNVVYFDELHKYKKWKSLLRGYQSELTQDSRIIVTGSARMEAYKKGGESLKGISFLYHVFPVSVAEIINQIPKSIGINEPNEIDQQQWESLLRFGGFPDPYLHSSQAFYNRWAKDRDYQLFHEDLREIDKSIDVKNIKNLSELLKHRVKSPVDYNKLANHLDVGESDVRRWISQLENLYYCFSIQPWYKQPSKSVRRNPKIYLWDWSELSDKGARYENLVAVHLKKAIEFWNDNGGHYDLFYLRNDEKELDFLVTRDDLPWLAVEVKSSRENIDNAFNSFAQYLKDVPHVLQVVGNMPYKNLDCFSQHGVTVVPMVSFLSQLI